MRGGAPLVRTATLCLLVLAGCGRGETRSPWAGPVVLVTFAGLGAGVVGALGGPGDPGGHPGLTPHLDALAAEADLAVRAVAPAGWEEAGRASLATGLQPWQHRVLGGAARRLRPELLTLAEALSEAGYRTTAFLGDGAPAAKLGYGQGFEEYRAFAGGRRAEQHLARLGQGRELVWIHVPEPQAPYVRRQALLSRLAEVPPDLPRRIGRAEVERWGDSAEPVPEAERRRLAAMYRLNVAWADERLGRLLAALEASGRRRETLLVVTSTHGEPAPGEGELSRAALEVPLVVDLPEELGRPLAPAEERIAIVRVWATIAEAAGARVPPAVAPSLFRSGPSCVLSESYLGNGTNRFSLVAGDERLLWTARFAPAEPGYGAARLRRSGGAGAGDQGGQRGQGAEQVLRRLTSAFAAAPPLSGRRELGPPELRLERWGPDGVRPVEDGRRAAELAAELERAFQRFLPEELPPREEWRPEGER